MKVTPTALKDVLMIEPAIHRDDRGFFLEFFQKERFEANGLPGLFVQDNHSRSSRGTLRGLHAQRTRPQGKLVRVVHGDIFDVAVDIRPGSPTFAKWVGVHLSAENARMLYVPSGYAHGFEVLSEVADVEYKCTEFYSPADEIRLIWNDPDIGIEWPIVEPSLSPKDKAGFRLKELEPSLTRYRSPS